MSKMKHITGSLAFFAGLTGLLFLFSAAVMPRQDGYNVIEIEKKINALEKETEDTIDVIVVGDSETYSAYNPLQLWKEQGITSYICGTHAQRLCDTVSVLKSSFELQSPKLVVLETNCLFRYAGVKPQEEDKIRNVAEKVFPVLRYHNRWKQILPLIDASEQKKIERESIRKGFKLRTDVLAYNGGEWMFETDERKKFGEMAEDYLKEIYELCEENQAELILVSTPAPDNWTYAKHNSVSDWATEHEVEFLDMNLLHQEMQIDWTKDTRDGGDHLNFEGARKLTRYFGNYLKENFELTDHREDVHYSSWDEAVENSGMKPYLGKD